MAPTPTPIAAAEPRQRTTVQGVVSAITYRPIASHPQLRIQVKDETGTLTLVFHGRRDIAGISPGRRLIASGTVAVDAGEVIIFDPEYCLQPPESGTR